MFALACVQSHQTNIWYFKHECQETKFLQFGSKKKFGLYKKTSIIHKRPLEAQISVDFASLFDKRMYIQGCQLKIGKEQLNLYENLNGAKKVMSDLGCCEYAYFGQNYLAVSATINKKCKQWGDELPGIESILFVLEN